MSTQAFADLPGRRGAVGVRVARDRRHCPAGGGQLVGEAASPGIVDADDRDRRRPARVLRLSEQLCLRLEVVLHRRVEVEVVLGEVREAGDVDVHAADPAEYQCVGGDLHDHPGHPLVPHPGEQGLQGGCLRSGQGGRYRGPVDPGPGGADQPHPTDGRIRRTLGEQRVFHHVGGRRLPAGAGDPDDRHPAGRVAVDLRGDRSQPPTAVVDDQDGPRVPGVREDTQARLVGEHAGARRLPGEFRAVVAGAGDGHEHAARRDVRGADRRGTDHCRPLRCPSRRLLEPSAGQVRKARQSGACRGCHCASRVIRGAASGDSGTL